MQLQTAVHNRSPGKLALDSAHAPRLGGGPKRIGVVSITRSDRSVARTRDFCALAHFSRRRHPGAYRIGSSAAGAGIEAVAFSNPARPTIAVAITGRDADEHRVQQVDLGACHVAFEIPADSAATVEIDTTPPTHT